MTALIISAEAASKEAAPAFPPFDPWHFPSQLFWLAVLFGFLYLVLSRLILPKLGGVMEQRESTIANDLDEAARLNDQAQDAQKAVETSIAEARGKARATADEARSKMDVELRAETAKVDAELEGKLSAAEERIEELRSEALTHIESIAGDAAATIVSRFDGSVSDGDVKAAVKAALNRS